MAQFGTSGKNPPWVRTAAGGLGQPSQLTSPLIVQAAIGNPAVASSHQQQQAQQQAASQTVYNAAGLTALGFAQMGMDQQRENVFLVQNAATLQPGTVLSQSGVAIPTSLASAGLALNASLATAPVATVSYPAPRALQHSSQFQQAQQLSQPPPQPTPKQRVFTGTVTKLHENFGFVDDDVFFQITCIKGTMPKVGDRVLVEASYNPNMPFKWNATRIQVLPHQMLQQSHIQSQSASSQGLIRPGLLSNNSQVTGLGGNQVTGIPSQITLTLSSQPGTTIPQNLAIQQAMGQAAQTYNQVPPPVSMHNISHGSAPLVNRMSGLISTRQRHSSPPSRREREREIRRDDRRERERHREREIERERPPPPRKRSRSPRPRSRSPPRRRIRINPRYVVQIPKISLDVKEVNLIELRKRYNNLYVPSDFFHSSFSWMDAFSLSHPFSWERPCNFQIMNKEVDNVIENNAVLEPPDVDYTYTAKVMLISAPSLEDVYQKSCALAEEKNDNKESFVHPTRLISFLVGLKNKNEIMAIGGPWSPSVDGPNPDKDPTVLIRTATRCCKALTGIDLGGCTKWYRFAEINYFRGETVHKGRPVPSRVETVVIFLPDVWNCTPTLKEWQTLTASYKKHLMKKLHEDSSPEASENQETEEAIGDSAKKDIHLSELELKSMKLADLRHELENRNLSCKGLKSQLVARLTKALKAEQNKEDEDEHVEDEDADEIEKADEKDSSKKKKEEEDKKKDEKERAIMERRYTLPDTPSIIVHPSATAKGGKFDCSIMSLSLLLDYRQEDNKEYSFEVSLFAELFNEMLARDGGFKIYCALANVPEKKVAEDKEKDKKRNKDKDDKVIYVFT
ncbi:Cell division cycle and apoptosis regulator protein 1, variant 2 [Chamberlinius hualienensis]